MIGKTFEITEASFSDDRRTALFKYIIETDSQKFSLEETVVFPLAIPEGYESNKLLESLHLALAISYYKAFIPPVIKHPYSISSSESDFWNKVYRNGLGEFLFVNKIDVKRLATFKEQTHTRSSNNISSSISWKDKAVLGIGGGKDSIVAGELLKKAGIDIQGFVLATGEILGQSEAVSNTMNIDLLAIERRIDRKIVEINNIDGAYNGHVPISLIFGLCGAMMATATASKYIVVANEASASIPQLQWQGMEINHQWSKSLEFEESFQTYLHENVSNNIKYFSAIRPLTSLGVAKIFSKFDKYHDVFTSDNSLFKLSQEDRIHPRWSIDSSKSLSSFILLAPYISKNDLIHAFGRNFLDELQLKTLFYDLLGLTDKPVLDCVGSPSELKYSICNIIKQGQYNDSSLISALQDDSNQHNLCANEEITPFLLQKHAIPSELNGLYTQMESML